MIRRRISNALRKLADLIWQPHPVLRVVPPNHLSWPEWDCGHRHATRGEAVECKRRQARDAG